jgi:hypothetical protein
MWTVERRSTWSQKMPSEQDIQSELQRLTGQSESDESFQNPQILVVDVDGNQSQMDVNPEAIASMGVGMSQAYMSRNGPTQPHHRRPRVTMTKAQLEEQKMNEAQGLPSNLDEASRVVELEAKLARMEALLSGGTRPAPPPVQSPPILNPSPIPLSPDIRNPQTLPESVMSLQPPPIPGPLVPSLNDSESSTALKRRVVKLSNGQTMEVAPVSMGPTVEQELVEQPGEVSTEDLWVEEPEPIKNDPKVEKLAWMIGEVVKFLRDRDPLLFFRRVLPKTVSRQVGYSAWPKGLQERFCVHFKTLLTDPVFIKSQVATALSFEFGHGLSPRKIAELIVLSAGFMAYSLSGAELNS